MTSSVKRMLNTSSDSNDASTLPTTKTAKQEEAPCVQRASDSLPAASTSIPRTLPLNSMPAQASPSFAPRDDYLKLLFRDNPSLEIKLRWLSEVNKNFNPDHTLAEVKMSVVTSRFVYISRTRKDIIDSVMRGDILSLFLNAQNSPQRSQKYPTYLLTRYPVCADPSLEKALPGVYRARRLIQDGEPINRIVITWSLPDQPPPYITFDFLPCLPACEVRRMKDEQPWCFRCWGIGHILRYCSCLEKCAWCAGQHRSLTCAHLPQSLPTSSASASPESAATAHVSDSPAVDTSQWQCPRYRQPSVNVWHGCTRCPTTSVVASTSPPQSGSHSSQHDPAASQAASLEVPDVSLCGVHDFSVFLIYRTL
ncbi:hypothetical protein E2C01_041914 [Portunus trituberculatus]|uniref:Uncharacterized protein n=1 Tax=Portunus trituberculatus TaxID=210409 RepID=A0A5B7FRZ5_PORTR|nr:hypothetical protein [Portunus trituberculatus]